MILTDSKESFTSMYFPSDRRQEIIVLNTPVNGKFYDMTEKEKNPHPLRLSDLLIVYRRHLLYWSVTSHSSFRIRKGRNVLFIDALNTFCLLLYGVGHMVKDHSEKGVLLLLLTTRATLFD